ncbi:hypothetical protein D3C78_1910480 [compost metagenome]
MNTPIPSLLSSHTSSGVGLNIIGAAIGLTVTLPVRVALQKGAVPVVTAVVRVKVVGTVIGWVV